jgi:hypothetical protein
MIRFNPTILCRDYSYTTFYQMLWAMGSSLWMGTNGGIRGKQQALNSQPK